MIDLKDLSNGELLTLERYAIEGKPFSGFSDWDECMNTMMNEENHDKQSAQKICGKLQSQEEKALDTEAPLPAKENEIPTETEFSNRIKDELERAKKEIIELLEFEKRRGVQLGEIKAIKDIPEKVAGILGLDTLKDFVNRAVKGVYRQGSEKVEQKLDMNIQPNDDAIQFIQNYTFDNIKGLERDTENKLRQELERGIMNNEGVNQLKKRVTQVTDKGKNRAETIARTEYIRASNMGEIQSIKDTGAKANKIWNATIDKRTCNICRRLNGKKVELNQLFEDNPSGTRVQSPVAHPNCRCSLDYEMLD